MSHFMVAVIVKDPKNIDETLEKVMSPYSEELQVEPYQEDCYCIGSKARIEIREQLDAKFGSIDKMRDDFWGKVRKTPQFLKDPEFLNTKEGENFVDKEWKKTTKPRFDAEELLKESHSDINKPRLDCEECNGTGKRTTTYNPKAKWDWYVIGGRWDGMIKNDRQKSDDGGFNFDAKHHQLGSNLVSVKEYLKIAKKNPDKVIPFAIVTPEGEWCEKGKMGWWAMVADEKDEDVWLNQAIGIVEKYPDHYIVGVDCHI